MSMVFAIDKCDNPIEQGIACYDEVKLNDNCNYVDIYSTNATQYQNGFYGQSPITYLNGYYFYNYTLKINDIGQFILRFCDGDTFSFVAVSNATTNLSIVNNPVNGLGESRNFTFSIVGNYSAIDYTAVFLFIEGQLVEIVYDIDTNIQVNDLTNNIYTYYTEVSADGIVVQSDISTLTNLYTSDMSAWSEFKPISIGIGITIGILLLAFLGLLFIGFYFKNPAFQIVAEVIGIGVGVFLISINPLLGITFILGNVIGIALAFMQ
jgi:hypothetical protein